MIFFLDKIPKIKNFFKNNDNINHKLTKININNKIENDNMDKENDNIYKEIDNNNKVEDNSTNLNNNYKTAPQIKYNEHYYFNYNNKL